MSSAAPLKIFSFYPREYWERKMSQIRCHSLLAIQRRPDVELLVSGTGWDDYDSSLTVQKNLDRLMPDADLMTWYQPIGPDTLDETRRFQGLSVPTCLRFNEAWWPQKLAMRAVLASGTKLVICHHANDMHQFAPWRGCQPLVRHIPLCAEKTIFYNASLSQHERDIPVLLIGALNRKVYPLRHRYAHLLNKEKLPGRIYQHPSYEMASHEETLEQVKQYAAHLGRSKIILVDSSRYKYPLAKYTEAALSGALVVGDLPEMAPRGFEDFIVPIHPRAFKRSIIKTIRYWLENEPARAERARHGQQIALEHFTQEHYAARFVEIAQSFLSQNKSVRNAA